MEAEARVLALLAHRPHVGDPRRGHHQPHAGVAHPERRQLPAAPRPGRGRGRRRRRSRRSARSAAGPRAAAPRRRGRRRPRGTPRGSRPAATARPRPVAAEALQVLGARLERRQQIEAGDAAARAAASPLAVERDRRPPGGGGARPAARRRSRPRRGASPRRPAPARCASLQLLGQLPPRRLRRRVDLALGRPPLGVRPAQLVGDLLGAPAVLGEQQLDPGVGPVQPPRRVDPRRQPERQVPLVQPSRLAFRAPPSAPAARPAGPPHLGQPALHQRPVLPDQRHHVGDRRQRDEVEVASRRVGAAVAAAATQAELPGDRRPAERLERIAARLPGAGSGRPAAPRPAWWWSVTTTSIPSSCARRTCSTAVIPQSTVISSAGPALGQLLDVLGAEPVAVGDPVGDQPVAVGAERPQRRRPSAPSR